MEWCLASVPVSNSKLLLNCALVDWGILDFITEFIKYEVTLGKAAVFGSGNIFAHLVY